MGNTHCSARKGRPSVKEHTTIDARSVTLPPPPRHAETGTGAADEGRIAGISDVVVHPAAVCSTDTEGDAAEPGSTSSTQRTHTCSVACPMRPIWVGTAAECTPRTVFTPQTGGADQHAQTHMPMPTISELRIEDGSVTQAELSRYLAEDRKHRIVILIDGNCYDVTSYAKSHPGGARVLRRYNGKDSSKAFARIHGKRAKELAKSYYVAPLRLRESAAEIR